MPNTTSAKKALRQSERKRVKNLSVKRNLKKTVKNFDGLVASGNFEEAKNQLPTVFKVLDKAAKASVIKKNKAARLKSRLSKKLNKATTSATEG